MRIHTDTLTANDLRAAIHKAGLDDVTVHVLGEYGSRSRARAFEVALRGHGRRHRYHPQRTILAGERERAATYDDWGWYFDALFRLDPEVRPAAYPTREIFDTRTRHRFAQA